eukprot:TRINITY_DN21582_c0_g1_i2.p1 TRINITY_DN21582_c0_g1~~TRINITY_DN21582_c0_g1_i2.p1  ORF type:complete len:314 (+),score=70.96 TRINITY_DN21582_c0_g1_i2:78-944(+)
MAVSVTVSCYVLQQRALCSEASYSIDMQLTDLVADLRDRFAERIGLSEEQAGNILFRGAGPDLGVWNVFTQLDELQTQGGHDAGGLIAVPVLTSLTGSEVLPLPHQLVCRTVPRALRIIARFEGVSPAQLQLFSRKSAAAEWEECTDDDLARGLSRSRPWAKAPLANPRVDYNTLSITDPPCYAFVRLGSLLFGGAPLPDDAVLSDAGVGPQAEVELQGAGPRDVEGAEPPEPPADAAAFPVYVRHQGGVIQVEVAASATAADLWRAALWQLRCTAAGGAAQGAAAHG